MKRFSIALLFLMLSSACLATAADQSGYGSGNKSTGDGSGGKSTGDGTGSKASGDGSGNNKAQGDTGDKGN